MSKKKSNSIYLNPKDAHEYFNYIQANPVNLEEQKLVKSIFPMLSGKKCLEIGCAGAIYSREMIKQNALKVDSMDNSPVMIEMARNTTKNKVSYYHQDINLKLNLKNTYDFICASYVLHYSQELNKTLTNIIQLLNAKGILIISVPNPLQFHPKTKQLHLGEKKIATTFHNHPKNKYLEILETFGKVVKTYNHKDVFIVKFQNS